MEEEMQKFLGGLSADQTKRARDEAESLSEQNKQLREELEVMGLSAEAKAALEQARLSSAIAVKEEALASRELTGATQGELDGLREQIRLLKERAGLLTDKSVKEAQIENKKLSEDMMGNIQHQLGDALYDAADGNFKKIGDAWLSTLKRMAADAAAAELMKAMFGESAKGGSGSGWIGKVLGLAAGAAGGGGSSDALSGFLALNNNFSGRATGGPVGAGGIYEVNEGGKPELLQMDGRNYLLAGKGGGSVIPAVADTGGGAARSNGDVVIHNYGAQKVTTQRRPDGRTEVTVREMAASLQDPNSPLSKAMKSVYNLQRPRS
ncbi:hypothetical protein D3C71_1322780 [compost metagenome]